MDFDEPNELLNANLNDHNIFSSPTVIPQIEADVGTSELTEELTTKKAVELLIGGTLKSKVCRYCLNISSSLSELDQVLQIAGTEALYKVTIRDMVASFHPFKVVTDSNFPNKICNRCLDRTLSAYFFTQQCEQTERALHNCFDDIYEKLEKLDPLDKAKRGRQKKNPNYNVLNIDHEKVIDYAEPNIKIINTKSIPLSIEAPMSVLECPKCWEIFTNLEDMIIHEKTHPRSMWFNCRLCGQSFVKRLQLRRHLKQAHSKPNMTIEMPDDKEFQCQTCGSTSKDYSAHLQHIEKHKFQMVLQHLVHRDMDKLCAVCLDKNPKLVDLDKMVRLHGGCPGAMGDKTMYNILGSTLPDRKSYKYKELHVPHHARIMKIAKLTKDKESKNDTIHESECTDKEIKNDTIHESECTDKEIKNYTIHESECTDKAINMNQIVITKPVVISNEKFDCDEIYLFFFSDPSDYKENQKRASEAKVVVKSLEHEKVKGDKLKTDEQEDINETTFEKPFINLKAYHELDTVIMFYNDQSARDQQSKLNMTNESIISAENLDSQAKHYYELPDLKTVLDAKNTVKKEELCKTCWIFNKPSCTACMTKLATIDESPKVDNFKTVHDKIKECQYCWIFKKSNKCDYCKNLIKIDTIAKENLNEEVDNMNIKKYVPRKRKLLDLETKTTKPNKTKWECHVCLTSNVMQREKCICCESNRSHQNNNSQVNFDCSHPFKISKVDDNVTFSDKSYAKMDMSPDIKNNLHEKKEIQVPTLIPEFHIETFQNINQCQLDFTPKAEENYILTEKIIEDAEKMEIIDEEASQIMIPNQFSFNVPAPNNEGNILIPNAMQFHIGAGTTRERGNRRIIKPIRRIAYHK